MSCFDWVIFSKRQHYMSLLGYWNWLLLQMHTLISQFPQFQSHQTALYLLNWGVLLFFSNANLPLFSISLWGYLLWNKSPCLPPACIIDIVARLFVCAVESWKAVLWRWWRKWDLQHCRSSWAQPRLMPVISLCWMSYMHLWLFSADCGLPMQTTFATTV